MRLRLPVSSQWRWLTPLIAAPILALIALGSWGLSSPVGSSPDDDFHLVSIWCAAGDRPGICTAGDSATTRMVPDDLVNGSICYRYNYDLSAACQGPGFGTHPSQVVLTDRGNFDGLYPPVYYLAMSVFAGPNIDDSVLAIRFANSALFVCLVLGLFLLLPARRRATLLWAFAVTVVPLGLFLIPSTNPSGWAILSAGVLWLSLLSYFETTGWRRIGLGAMAILATVMAAGARADAAVYSALAVGAVLILAIKRNRQFLLSAVLPVGLAVVAVGFWLSARQSTATSAGLAPRDGAAVDVKLLAATDFLNVPDLWVGAFGHWGLGWVDTDLPDVVWVAAFGIFCAALFLGLRIGYRRKALVAGLVFAALWIFPTVVLVQTRATVGSFVQPRYIYPLIILLAGIAFLQVREGQLSVTRWQAFAGIVGLSIANAVALHTNIRRYVTGLDVGGLNLNSYAEWWWNIPFSPMLVWLIGSASFGAALLALASGLIWPQARQDEPVGLSASPQERLA